MKKIAMIDQNGIVQNIAVWDGVSQWHPEGYLLIDVTNLNCQIGDSYNNGVFTTPEGTPE